MNSAVKDILAKVAGWPQEDQEELAELAREIETRRTGVYELSANEQKAIAEARAGAFAFDDEVSVFWTKHIGALGGTGFA